MNTDALPTFRENPAALLCFNVGVEIGQIVFVGTVLGVVWTATTVLRRIEIKPNDWWRRIEKPLAYTVGSVAMYWTTQRVLSFWS